MRFFDRADGARLRRSWKELVVKCPASLRVVDYTGLGRQVRCPTCGALVRPLRLTLDGRAQLRSHAAPVRGALEPPRPARPARKPRTGSDV
jgi:hypothetical protein